ncbi:hypothetical protein P7G58_04900 [Globicatella sulfidifaciens]|uniref:hypothetical protein n=1 Tax=Globicatella sulfidifaciens TaxID=136093 RepID=UPI00288D8651|nr:hypothetical protein [Globicatella sulfidifaciens]MDT2768201.1 hypothetical protein [Globicatella sulfidifaciens]
MALGILGILNIVLITVAVIIQALLYKNKNESKNNIFIINMLLGILLSWIVYTSLPTNFTEQRILAISLGLISVSAVVVKLKTEKFIVASKVMLSISIVGGLFQLLS